MNGLTKYQRYRSFIIIIIIIIINTRIDKTIIHVQCNQCRSFQSMFFIQIIYYSTHNLQFKLAVGSRYRRHVCINSSTMLTPNHIQIKKYVAANN